MPQYRNIPFNSACHSTVAEPGGRVLCVGVPELVECGVSQKTIFNGVQNHRTGLVYCWPHHKEGREVFVHYDGMAEKYQTLVNKVLCGDVEAHLWVENMEAAALNKKLSAVKRSLSGMVEVSAADMSELTQMQLFIPSDVQRIARAAGWMRLWRRMDVKTARKYGFTSIKEIHGNTNQPAPSGQSKLTP